MTRADRRFAIDELLERLGRRRWGNGPRMNEAIRDFHNSFWKAVTEEISMTGKLRQRRRTFATAELPNEKVQAIGASRMDERHAHLDAMLEQNHEARRAD